MHSTRARDTLLVSIFLDASVTNSYPWMPLLVGKRSTIMAFFSTSRQYSLSYSFLMHTSSIFSNTSFTYDHFIISIRWTTWTTSLSTVPDQLSLSMAAVPLCALYTCTVILCDKWSTVERSAWQVASRGSQISVRQSRFVTVRAMFFSSVWTGMVLMKQFVLLVHSSSTAFSTTSSTSVKSMWILFWNRCTAHLLLVQVLNLLSFVKVWTSSRMLGSNVVSLSIILHCIRVVVVPYPPSLLFSVLPDCLILICPLLNSSSFSRLDWWTSPLQGFFRATSAPCQRVCLLHKVRSIYRSTSFVSLIRMCSSFWLFLSLSLLSTAWLFFLDWRRVNFLFHYCSFSIGTRLIDRYWPSRVLYCFLFQIFSIGLLSIDRDVPMLVSIVGMTNRPTVSSAFLITANTHSCHPVPSILILSKIELLPSKWVEYARRTDR